jgi:hypothetical protein
VAGVMQNHSGVKQHLGGVKQTCSSRPEEDLQRTGWGEAEPWRTEADLQRNGWGDADLRHLLTWTFKHPV